MTGELLVVLLDPDLRTPAVVSVDVPVAGWRTGADGVSQLIDVVAGDGSPVMLVAAVSPLAGLRVAAAEAAGSDVWLRLFAAQLDEMPWGCLADVADTFDVPMLIDTSESGLVCRRSLAVAGAR